MCSLLQSGLLKGKLLAAWVCTVSYEHRPGDCWEMKSRELVHFVTQQTRFALVNNILQHPEQLPSMYELEELNPSVSGRPSKHIQKLIDAGIVREVPLDDDQRRQGYPGSSTASQRRARPSSTNTISLAAEKPSNRSTRPSPTSPRRWSKYENAPRPDDA